MAATAHFASAQLVTMIWSALETRTVYASLKQVTACVIRGSLVSHANLRHVQGIVVGPAVVNAKMACAIASLGSMGTIVNSGNALVHPMGLNATKKEHVARKQESALAFQAIMGQIVVCVTALCRTTTALECGWSVMGRVPVTTQ